MTPHINDMSYWPVIECQRGHVRHANRTIHVDLAKPHLYHDYAQVPPRLAINFDMDIWDWRQYDEDGPYCPARDTVSETIETIGIWEPIETILALQVFSTATEDQQFLDLGSQIGWFSHLAQASNVEPVAFDADLDCMQLLRQQFIPAERRRFGIDLTVMQPGPSIRLMKLDLEGAEKDGIDVFWPSIQAGDVDHILMEVSPCFNQEYPELLDRIVGVGYDLYALPEKHTPPHRLDDPARDLEQIPRDYIESYVNSFDQADVWLKYRGADW